MQAVSEAKLGFRFSEHTTVRGPPAKAAKSVLIFTLVLVQSTFMQGYICTKQRSIMELQLSGRADTHAQMYI